MILFSFFEKLAFALPTKIGKQELSGNQAAPPPLDCCGIVLSSRLIPFSPDLCWGMKGYAALEPRDQKQRKRDRTMSRDLKAQVHDFWEANPCGRKFVRAELGTR